MKRWILLVFVFACGTTPASSDGGADAEDEPVELPLPPRDAPQCAKSATDLRGFARSYALASSGSIQRDKAFPLTTLLADPAIASLIANDATLKPIAQDRDAKLRAATAKCDTNAPCYAVEVKLGDVDAQTIATALPPVVGTLATAHLRPSGMFALRASGTDAELVSKSWLDTKDALNAAYDSYAATLDGASLKAVVTAAADPNPMPFYMPLLRVVLGALTAQKRDEAIRYEPLEAMDNQAALGAIPKTDWSGFPYSVILVPGLGPGSLDVPLSMGGAQRCDLAAARFRAKYAPFIAVTGGHVHPDRTPYSEAIEMKKHLIAKHSIPASAILVDPHARHTTTNLRNVGRQLFRYGVPIDRPVLITSDVFQTTYIGNFEPDFGPRCDKELGYRPWESLAILSPNDACMKPSVLSLQADGRDTLDP